MAKDLAWALHSPQQHIGDWKGRGRDQQIAQIKSAIRSPAQFVVYADVTACFASVNIDHLHDLEILPEELIRRALDYRSLIFRKDNRLGNLTSEDDVDEASPRGLLEGSPASNALWAVMIDDLPSHMPDGVSVFSYCDNIVVIAPNLEAAQQSQEALVSYFRRHRAGPFEIRREITSVVDQFEHLGYQIALQVDGQVWVGLADKNAAKLRQRAEGVARLSGSDAAEKLAEAMIWLRASFSEITPQAREIFLGELVGPN